MEQYVLISHVGSHTSISRIKLKVLCTVVDEINGVEYNWADLFIQQLIEASREVQRTDSSFAYGISAHIRYGNVLTAAFLNLAKKKGEFFDRSFQFEPRTRAMLSDGFDEKLTEGIIPDIIEDVSDSETAKKTPLKIAPAEPAVQKKRSKAKKIARKLVLQGSEEEADDEPIAQRIEKKGKTAKSSTLAPTQTASPAKPADKKKKKQKEGKTKIEKIFEDVFIEDK